MRPFELVRHDSLAAARSVTTGGDGRVVRAGGIDLLDRMQEGLDAPSHLVELRSIRDLPDLRVLDTGGPIRLGALVTLAELADAAELPDALRTAASEAATPGIRNTATLGGNLLQRPRCWYYRNAELVCLKKGGDTCLAVSGRNKYHAILGGGPSFIVHPSSLATALLALDATIHVARTNANEGELESLPLGQLFVGPKQDPTREHILDPGDVLVRVDVPRTEHRSAYRAAREKQSHDWPLVEAAVSLRLSGDRMSDVRVVLGHVAPIPWLATAAMKVLEGQPATAERFEAAAVAAVEGARPLDENAYKVALARGLVRHALHAATELPLPP